MNDTRHVKAFRDATKRSASFVIRLAAASGLMSLLAACGGSNGSDAAAQNDAVPSAAVPVTAASPAASAAASAPGTDTTAYIEPVYQPYAGALQNPDRGFYTTENLISSATGNVTGQPDYAFVRRAGYTLVRSLVRLDDFRNQPISAAALAQMEAGFANLRQNGLKAQLGFKYNFPANWDVSVKPPDAPLSIVLQHLDQLKPVFDRNKDVIASLSRGFIGAWGEGHSSSNGLDEPAAKQAIFDKLLAVVPADRMIQLRTVPELLASVPGKVDATNAHDQSTAARIGLINACFMVNDSDAGTFAPPSEAAAQRDHLAAASKYVVVGGETCEVPTTTRRDNCANARIELARYHFTYLNDVFYGPTIDAWKHDGCFDEIADKLGYRIELLRSKIAKSTQAGAALRASVTLRNVGYAAPYNERGLAIALRNKQTLKIVWLNVKRPRDKTLDPRLWLPEDGEITLDLSPVIPVDTLAGKYEVLLSLHDPVQALSSMPAFSIRTANEGLWEAGSGWNRLTSEIDIVP
jgi:hypothetical protein